MLFRSPDRVLPVRTAFRNMLAIVISLGYTVMGKGNWKGVFGMAKENMTLQMEPELKEQASALFDSLGLDLSTATGLFYRQALRCNGLPFEVSLNPPNAVTIAAMKEAEEMAENPMAYQRYHSFSELLREVEADA